MKESLKNQNKEKENPNRPRIIRIRDSSHESSLVEDKKQIDHKITLADVKHFNTHFKLKKKTFKNKGEAFRYKLHKLVDNVYFQVVIIFIGLYALFYREILLLALPQSFDSSFEFAIQLFFFILLTEFLICLISKKNYIGSFEFFIDVISLIGLIPEVTIFWDNILNIITNSR